MRNQSFGEKPQSLLDQIIARVRQGKVSSYLKEKKGRLLDLGCGYRGELLEQNKDVYEGYGIDLSVDPKNKKLKQGRVDAILPYPKAYFNVVTALAIIEHVEQPQIMLSESYRVLTSGGMIIITTPSISGKWPLELMAYLGIISREEIADHKRYYTRETLEGAMRQAGFAQVTVKHFGILWLNLIGVGEK